MKKKLMLLVTVVCFILAMPMEALADEQEVVVVSTDSGTGLNLRYGPSMDAEIYVVAENGTKLNAFNDYENGFRRVEYEGISLWAYSLYLKVDRSGITTVDGKSVYTFNSGFQIGFDAYPTDFTGIITNKSIQKMKLVVDGEEVLVSDVVTGTKDLMDTPCGEFEIWYKERDHTFTTYGGTSKYWMPIRWAGGYGTDYGFHDAPWKSRFGGDVYVTNGSHGCINMPTDKAKELFDYAYPGLPVYIIE